MTRDDSGFTLVELLLAVVMLTVLAGVLGTSLMVSFRTTDATTERLGRAHDVQIATASFTAAAQSASVVEPGDHTPGCGPAGAVLSLSWDDEGFAEVASFSLIGAAAPRALVLHRCTGTGAPRRSTISHYVATVAVPSCDGLPCPAGGSAPERISWTVTDVDGATHTLQGSRRTG